MPNFKSVVLFPLEDFGWWVTILGMVGDHPWDGGWPSMAPHLVLIRWVKSVPNFKSVDLSEGYLLVTWYDGGKTKSTPTPDWLGLYYLTGLEFDRNAKYLRFAKLFCVRFVLYMADICLIFIWYMHEVCMRFASVRLRIWGTPLGVFDIFPKE